MNRSKDEEKLMTITMFNLYNMYGLKILHLTALRVSSCFSGTFSHCYHIINPVLPTKLTPFGLDSCIDQLLPLEKPKTINNTNFTCTG